MALTTEEKQEIINILGHYLTDLQRKYQKINTKFNNFKTNWGMTPEKPEQDLSKLSDGELSIRFRTLRKLKAELDNVTGLLDYQLNKVDIETVRRRDA